MTMLNTRICFESLTIALRRISGFSGTTRPITISHRSINIISIGHWVFDRMLKCPSVPTDFWSRELSTEQWPTITIQPWFTCWSNKTFLLLTSISRIAFTRTSVIDIATPSGWFPIVIRSVDSSFINSWKNTIRSEHSVGASRSNVRKTSRVSRITLISPCSILPSNPKHVRIISPRSSGVLFPTEWFQSFSDHRNSPISI